MIYDELIEELALTLLTKARYEGCISVIDGFSQCEEDKTRIEYPIDGVMRIMPVGSEIWPEECEPLLKKIGAETIGDVADYLNKSKSENSSADDVLFTALLKICYENLKKPKPSPLRIPPKDNRSVCILQALFFVKKSLF